MLMDCGMMVLHVGVLIGLVAVAAYVAVCQESEVEFAALPSENGPEKPKFSSRFADGDQAEEIEANRALKQVEEDAVPDSGRVVLRWCGAAGEFEYWADRAVSYPNLEALARKWVLVYKEPTAYVERKRVLQLQQQLHQQQQQQLQHQQSSPPAASVFAALKTYAPPTPAVKLEQANLYRWRGKGREVPTPEPEKERPTLRYSDYKKNV
jgi:hypothetical protein